MQYELNLRDYIRIFQKRKWIVISMPILAAILGYLLTPAPPLLHEARGRLKVSKRMMPSEAMMDAFYYMEEGSRLDTHAQVMLSREVLKEVAMNLGLLPATTGPDGELQPVSDAELRRRQDYRDRIEALRSSMLVDPLPATSILQITCTRPDEQEAVEWVNALIDTYETINRYEINRAVIDGLDFLEKQLEETAGALRDAEDRLADFKRANADAVSLTEYETDTALTDLESTERDLRAVDLQIEVTEQAIATGSMPSLDVLGSLSGTNQASARMTTELSSLEQRRQELLAYQTESSPEVHAVAAQIDSALRRYRDSMISLRVTLEQQRQSLEARLGRLPENDVILARLQRQVDINNQLYSQLNVEYLQARLRFNEQMQEVQVIERAVGATQVPQAGRTSKALVAGGIGLLLGIIAALVVETLDTSIGAIEDVESLLDLPVIGIVPPINFDEVRDVVRGVAPQLLEHPDAGHLLTLVSHYDPRSPVSEAYRAIRTNVERARSRVEGKVVVVTSSVLEEGKTTTSSNLALTFAQMGRRTLLIAADLRRPNLHRVYGVRKEPGLADVLTGSIPWEAATRGLSDILLGELSMDIVMLTPGMDNLSVLPSGSNPLNPAELLSSEATREVLEKLRQQFDIIIVDTPPVIPVTDSAILAEHADGVVLVYEVGKVGRDVLKRARNHLDNVHADIWGIVMNDVKAEAETSLRDTDYYYRYRYEDSPTRRAGLRGLGRTAARLLRVGKR